MFGLIECVGIFRIQDYIEQLHRIRQQVADAHAHFRIAFASACFQIERLDLVADDKSRFGIRIGKFDGKRGLKIEQNFIVCLTFSRVNIVIT